MTGQAASGGKTHDRLPVPNDMERFSANSSSYPSTLVPFIVILFRHFGAARTADRLSTKQLRARAPHELPTQVIGW